MKSLFLFIFYCFVACAFSGSGKHVLILIENISIRETHSIFLRSLRDRGYELTFKYADDSSISLKKLGEYIYDNIIIFSPSVREFGGSLNVKELVRFVDDGGNVIVAGSHEIGDAVKEFSGECGVEFDDEKTSVIDHMNYDILDDGQHTRIIIDPENIARVPVISGEVNKPILYRGIGIAADLENPLLVNIMHGSSSSYSYTLEKMISEYPHTAGVNTQLITGLQARNDARVLFVGSLDFFSDEFFVSKPTNAQSGKRYEESGNREMAINLALWTFKETGVLRITSVHHHKVGEQNARREYTIMDDIVYSVTIEMKDSRGSWVTFSGEDVQLELVRIDPFIRQRLLRKDDHYELKMKLPDVYGVFKLVVDYHRTGYTHVFTSTQISVRPFTHTQYERFILSAYPYYASAISMMAGVVLFSFVFLYLKDDKEKSE